MWGTGCFWKPVSLHCFSKGLSCLERVCPCSEQWDGECLGVCAFHPSQLWRQKLRGPFLLVG